MKRLSIILSCLLILAASACTIDLQSTPIVAPPVPGKATASATPSTVSPAASSTAATQPLKGEKVPITWSALKLTGRLVFIRAIQRQGNPTLSIQILDLGTGEVSTVFQAPELGWIYSASVAPGGRELVMTYTPPPQANTPQPQRLYRLPLDGAQPPAPLMAAGDPSDQYFQPEWSPDGKTLYFAHVNYDKLPKDQHYPTFALYRMTYPDGQPEQIADAFWPRVSPDGTRLVYITTDPATGRNRMVLADPDGKNPRPVTFTGSASQDIIDAPLILPDGKSILFSAPSPQAYQPPSWLEALLGIETAQAHTVPSEWWRVPVDGGEPVQITHIQAPGLYACLSPDGRYIASFSGSGIFVMQSDGTALTMVMNDLGGIYGTVSWIQ